MKTLFSSLAIVWFGLTLSLAQFNKEKLDQYFDVLETYDKFNGSVALSKNGEIIYTRSLGYSDIDNKITGNDETKYRIGSISKTFTATLVLKAMEEGKLDLNQTIGQYFPSVKNSEKITISNLLSHRSGIYNLTDLPDYMDWNTQAKTREELVGIISKSESVFEPDSKGEYSNSNYILLTFILEDSYKQPFADILNEKITKPLDLKNTYVGGKIITGKNEAVSYSFNEKWMKEPETDSSIPLGAGAIVSTPTDLIKFGEALFSGKIISEKSLKSMKTLKDNYGMGLFQIPFQEKEAYGHNGGIDGFSSMWGHFQNENVSLAITSNGSNFSLNESAIALLSSVFDADYDLPNFKKTELSSEELDLYLGTYANEDIPLKVTFTKKNNQLYGQVAGQPEFPLDAMGNDEFRFDAWGIVMKFSSDKSSFILNQGGGQFNFVKE